MSEVIRRAGGPTNQAFLRGASLTRQTTDEERVVQRAKQRMANRDSLTVFDNVGANYSVGIELDKAVQRPGSEYDIILREGDRIYIPEQQTTVRVSGNVLYPNAVTYVPGKSVDYYVSAAGGYGFRAKRGKTYIVYQNGNVRRTGVFSSKVEPGCEIIVPTRPERQGMTTGEIVSIASSTASIGLMVASLINIIKK